MWYISSLTTGHWSVSSLHKISNCLPVWYSAHVEEPVWHFNKCKIFIKQQQQQHQSPVPLGKSNLTTLHCVQSSERLFCLSDAESMLRRRQSNLLIIVRLSSITSSTSVCLSTNWSEVLEKCGLNLTLSSKSGWHQNYLDIAQLSLPLWRQPASIHTWYTRLATFIMKKPAVYS